MARRERTLPPEIEAAVVTARVAGLSERAVYETLRDKLAEVPSYRDLRAAYVRAGVWSRSDVAAARREGRFPITQESLEGIGQYQARTSRYLSDREVVREVDRTEDARDALDEKYLLGYMRRAGVDPDSLDDEALAERLANIYDGIGS